MGACANQCTKPPAGEPSTTEEVGHPGIAEVQPCSLAAVLPPNGAGLLDELLELRIATQTEGTLVPVVLQGATPPVISLKPLAKGASLAAALTDWNASLVGGALRSPSDTRTCFFSAAALVKAAKNGQVAIESLEPSQGTGVMLGSTSAYHELLTCSGGQVVVWKLPDYSAKGAEELLLRHALDLVKFNFSTSLGEMQQVLDTAASQLDELMQSASLQDLVKMIPTLTGVGGNDNSDGSNKPRSRLLRAVSTLTDTEKELEDAESDLLPIDQNKFMRFLQEPEAGTETGFRMRHVIDAHPTMPVFMVTDILKAMENKGITVASPGRSLAPQRVVFSDIDDTVHPAHDAKSVKIAGQDVTQIAKGELYPGIVEVHRALRSNHTDNKVAHPVLLSARPAVLAKKSKAELQLLASRMARVERLPEQDLYCSVLPGAEDVQGMLQACAMILYQNLPTVQQGMICALGQKKIERVFQYARLFPEPSFVFIGDDGQGDFEAARGLLDLKRTKEGGISPSKEELFAYLDRTAGIEEPQKGAADEGAAKRWLGKASGAVQALGTKVSQAATGADAADAYVALLKAEAAKGARQFSAANPPLFDFVAIKAVQTKGGFLFPLRVRSEREMLMQKIYGQKRFFYFVDYGELSKKLAAAGWTA